METRKQGPTFARLSFGLLLVPVGLFMILLSGGGSSGFGAWNDLAMLLGVMLLTAVLGLVFSGISVKRQERSVLNAFALVVHCLILLFLAYALGQ